MLPTANNLQSLTFYYIRSLIHRPAVGSTLGNKSSPSVISLADSSKHIIQIVQLLEERNMAFSFCLNKNEMLTLCGLSLLYQGLDLKQEGKLMQDSQRMVAVVVKYLEKAKAPGEGDFKRLAGSIINLESQAKTTSPHVESTLMRAPKITKSPLIARKQVPPALYRHSSASMSESDLLSQQEKIRRATLPNISMPSLEALRYYGRASMDSSRSDPPKVKREYRSSASQLPPMVKPLTKNVKPPNLDYLSLSNTPVSSHPSSPTQTRTHHPLHTSTFPTSASTYNPPQKSTTAAPSEWEILLGSFDDRHLYDAIYGGSTNGPTPALSIPDNASSNFGAWSPDSWDYNIGLGDFTNNAAGPANSVLSFSEESLSSGDDLSASDLIQHDYNKPALVAGNNNSSNDPYDYLINGLDNGFGL